MEDEIEIGEYVRTKNGLIGTLIEISEAGSGVRYAGEFITDTIFSIHTKPHTEVRLKDGSIVKHSKDIIDIIQIGDIVEILLNGITGATCLIEIADNELLDSVRKANIKCFKSIVTKEQLESIKYEV